MDHDHRYKLLFSHREMMADLLRGFVREAWGHTVELATLERVPIRQVSGDGREREDEIIWRVRWQEGWLYIDLFGYSSTQWRLHEGILHMETTQTVKILGRFIVADPKVCHGQPTFRGTRVFVADVLDQVARGLDWETIIEEWHGSITHDAIAEAVHLAAQALLKHADDFVVASTAS
jgi:uncharacterized protein (DUF433 family)